MVEQMFSIIDEVIIYILMRRIERPSPPPKIIGQEPAKMAFSNIFVQKKSSPNLNSDTIKAKQYTNFAKGIARHSSEQEFKKHPETVVKVQQDLSREIQEEYFTMNKSNLHLKMQNKYYQQTIPSQTKVQTPSSKKYNTKNFNEKTEKPKNYLKETSSTNSTDLQKNLIIPTFVKLKGGVLMKSQTNIVEYQLTKDRFKIMKKLGEGRFAQVFLVKDRVTEMIMAMKIMEKKKIINQNFLDQFIRELKIQTYLDHPNIIQMYGFFTDEVNFYLLMELGEGGHLYDIIEQGKKLTEEATSIVVKNLLEGVNHMHSKKILHRDIKPENIILSIGNVKLCDFGWAVNKATKQELRSTFCGTPLYLSPEVLKGQRYDEKVDIWSIGILAYQLIYGVSPFDISTQQDLCKIISDSVKVPKCQSYQKVSKYFQEFIMLILNKNPVERMTCEELLKTKFIQAYNQLQTTSELCQ